MSFGSLHNRIDFDPSRNGDGWGPYGQQTILLVEYFCFRDGGEPKLPRNRGTTPFSHILLGTNNYYP